MQYESNRPTGSSGGLIVAVLLVLLLGGIGIVGAGTYFWMRSQATAREAAAMERAALEAQMRAIRDQELQNQALAAAPEDDKQLPSVEMIHIVPSELAKAEVSITIAADGSTAIHGRSVSQDELPSELKKLAGRSAGGNGADVRVSIWADPECAFRDVAAVLRGCREAGVESIEIAAPGGGAGDR
jgi:biopolymer transport protein ExbD